MKSRRTRKWYGEANESWRRDPERGKDQREAVGSWTGAEELVVGQERGELVAGEQRGKQQLAVGGRRPREAVGSWTGAEAVGVDPRRGSQHQTPSREARRQDRGPVKKSLKMSDPSSIVEFSLVTHASDSLHMHIVLQTPSSALGNPKLCLFVCLSNFSCLPRSYSCVGKEMCVTPSVTSWSPAG